MLSLFAVIILSWIAIRLLPRKPAKEPILVEIIAWNVAVREMVKQEEKSQDNKPFKSDAEKPAPPTCMFCGGKYFHKKTCKMSSYRTA